MASSIRRTTKCRLVAAIFIGICCLATVPLAVAGDNPPGISVTFPDEAVAGLPLPFHLRIHGPISIPEPRLFRSVLPFSFKMVTEGQHYVFPKASENRYPLVVGTKMAPSGRIVADRVVRLAKVRLIELRNEEETSASLDLGQIYIQRGESVADRKPLLRARFVLLPGDYILQVGDQEKVTFSQTDLKVVAPNATEEDLSKQLDELVRRTSSSATMVAMNPEWTIYVLMYPEISAKLELEKISNQGKKQLHYYTVLARLVHDQRPISELDFGDEMLADIIPAYKADLLLLRLEIEIARNDQEAAKKTRSEIIQERPSMEIYLDGMKESKRGYIQKHRSYLEDLNGQ